MSLQTPSDVKVKKEAPVEVDSSPPDSPESISGKSDHSREALVKAKVEKWEEGGLRACGILNDGKKVFGSRYVSLCLKKVMISLALL